MIEFLRAVNEVMDLFPWRGLALLAGGVWLAVGLSRMNSGKSKFSVDDLFLDRRDRADLYKLVVIIMAALTVYVVLKLVESDKPVETLLLGALGIFIGGRAISAFAGRDAPKDEDVKVDKTEEGK